jgi:acylphosphatase
LNPWSISVILLDMADKRAHLMISGRVQGVFYRDSSKKMADYLGLKGWVKNNPSGQVEMVVQGSEINVKSMIQWCHQGPSRAKVSQVDVKWETRVEAFEDFKVTH